MYVCTIVYWSSGLVVYCLPVAFDTLHPCLSHVYLAIFQTTRHPTTASGQRLDYQLALDLELMLVLVLALVLWQMLVLLLALVLVMNCQLALVLLRVLTLALPLVLALVPVCDTPTTDRSPLVHTMFVVDCNTLAVGRSIECIDDARVHT